MVEIEAGQTEKWRPISGDQSSLGERTFPIHWDFSLVVSKRQLEGISQSTDSEIWAEI
jgi:hypothetical protein